MIAALKKFFDTHLAIETDSADDVDAERACQLATAALLIEMSRADFDVKNIEQQAILSAIDRAFGLGAEETQALIDIAESKADDATSLYEFTRLINDNYDPRQKVRIVELLWDVAIADGEIDKYEEHLVRNIAELIHVPHKEFIRAKHRAAAGAKT